jgi:hypothetical protein
MSTEASETLEEDINTGIIAEQFAQSKTGEIELQSLTEVYSILRELENYTGSTRERLITYVDEFASEIPVDTSTEAEYATGREIAEEFGEFVSLNLESTPSQEVAMKKAKAYLGDKLRYFQDSSHSK